MMASRKRPVDLYDFFRRTECRPTHEGLRDASTQRVGGDDEAISDSLDPNALKKARCSSPVGAMVYSNSRCCVAR